MIDYCHATPREVIARSHALHPSLLRDSVNAARKVHLDYAAATHDAHSANIARKMARDCEEIAGYLDADYIDGICIDCSRRTIALQCALKLLCVPRSLWGDIAARG